MRRTAAVVAVVAAALAVSYALAGFFLVPYLLERELTRYARDRGLQAEVGRLASNPFAGTLDATGIALKADDGARLGRIERFHAQLAFTSLIRGPWRFAEIVIEGPEVDLLVDRRGSLNWSALRRQEAPADGSAREPPARHVVIEDLRISDARLRYVDDSRAHPVRLEAGPIAVQATNVSNVAEAEGQYALTAMLPDNAALTAKGTIALEPLASTGTASLTGLQLHSAWPLLRDHLRIAIPRGLARASGNYRFRRAAGAELVLTDGEVQVEQLRLAMPDADRPLLELATARATGVRYESPAGAVTVADLVLSDGRYNARLDAGGRLDWTRLAGDGEGRKGASWRVNVDAAALRGIAVRYEDHTRRTPLRLDVGSSDARLKLRIAAGENGGVLADEVALELREIVLSGVAGHAPLLTFDAVEMAGGRLDTREHAVAVNAIALTGGEATLLRDDEDAIPLLRAFEPAKPAAAPGPQWRYRVGEAVLERARLAVGDAGYDPPLRYDLDLARLALKNIDASSAAPVALEASLRASQGGSLRASGTARQDFGGMTAKIDADAVNLVPLRAVLGRYATLELRSGTAGARASIDYGRDSDPQVRVTGEFDLADVAIDDVRTGQRFLSWKRVAGESTTLTLAPGRLDVQELLIDQPETAVIIAKDRKVNLAQVVIAQEGAAAAEPSDAAPFPVRVGRLRVRDGTVDFADFSLVLPFSTRVHRVSGSALGISTDPAARTELKLGGRIEPSGYASAEGALNLRHPTDFLDIDVRFQNVEMPPLSPYTATFAGRTIDGGRLWLDLDYRISQRRLSGDNRILMENIVLGERVQAPGAADLPLELAIALLKDSQGRIRMAVPVSGDVDNPQFDYRSLIREAIATAIGRIVTAPFRAIAALFGGGTSGEELATVRFAAGSTRLFPPQRENLEKVAAALRERPELKVVVHGAYDPARDAERLRRDPLRRELARTMGQALQPGEDPGPVAYSDPDTQRAIETLFVARAGEDALREHAAEYGQRQGGSVASLAPDERRAYYEAMFARLVALEPLPEAAVRQLGGERARAIAAFLVEAGVEPERIEVGALRSVGDEGEPTIDARLELMPAERRSGAEP